MNPLLKNTKMLYKIKNLLIPNKKIIRKYDLKPKGIRSTYKSSTHGTVEDFNETWKYIHSQFRNFDLYKKEYGREI